MLSLRREAGKELQGGGPAAEKLLSISRVCNLGTVNVNESTDSNDCRPSCHELTVVMEVYCGSWSCSAL